MGRELPDADGIADGREVARQRSGARGDRPLGIGRVEPLAVGGDRHRDDLIARRVERGGDRDRGGA